MMHGICDAYSMYNMSDTHGVCVVLQVACTYSVQGIMVYKVCRSLLCD